jgi:uncharacterized protein YjbI with pentapeptide repeats
MLAKLRFRRPSHATVVAYLALFVALGGTGAYAANEWTGTNIVDSSLTGADVRGKPGTSSAAAVNGSLTTDDIAGQQANAANGTPFIDGTLTQWDVKNGSIATADLATNAVTTAKVADNNLTGADVLDSTIKSADIAPLTITGFDIGFNAIEDVHVKDDTLTEFDIDEARLFHMPRRSDPVRTPVRRRRRSRKPG